MSSKATFIAHSVSRLVSGCQGWRMVTGIGLWLGAMALGSSAATAQDADPTFRAMVDRLIDTAAKRWVRVVGPRQVEFDPHTKIATVRLVNPSVDTVAFSLD